MKDYSQPYETPYYAELKRKSIRLPCFLTHIRTDAARIEKPTDARMFRMLFLTPRTDGCCGTIDTSSNTNLIMLRIPCILQKQRSEEGKKIRRQYKNDIGVPYQACKVLLPKADGICPTLTTFQTDTNIMEMTEDKTVLVYHEHPTKEDLLEYFGQRIKVRKMHEREALRLMDFSEESIDRMMNAEIRTTLKSGKVKTRKMPKTQLYKQAGNSIVCSCIYHIGRTLWIPDQQENGCPVLEFRF